MQFKTLLFSLFIMFSTGCVTGGAIIRETPLNVSDTRKIVTTVIGVPLSVSENGRELYSQYHDGRGRSLEKPDAVRNRYQTVVIILGDRRPYDVQVLVNMQVRGPEGKFEHYDRNDDMAEATAEKIRNALNQSRGQRNVIDDFRSF